MRGTARRAHGIGRTIDSAASLSPSRQTTGARASFLYWRNVDRSAMGVALWDALIDVPATPTSLINDLYAMELQRIVLNMQVSLLHTLARQARLNATAVAHAETTYRYRVARHIPFKES